MNFSVIAMLIVMVCTTTIYGANHLDVLAIVEGKKITKSDLLLKSDGNNNKLKDSPISNTDKTRFESRLRLILLRQRMLEMNLSVPDDELEAELKNVLQSLKKRYPNKTISKSKIKESIKNDLLNQAFRKKIIGEIPINDDILINFMKKYKKISNMNFIKENIEEARRQYIQFMKKKE